MLETFTLFTFSNRIGEAFRIVRPGSPPVTLALGTALKLGAEGRPFSLVFLGPVEGFLSQGTYRVEHDELGAFDLFVVPLGPDPAAGGSMRYEAIFN